MRSGGLARAAKERYQAGAMTSSGREERFPARVVDRKPLSPSVVQVGMQGPADYSWLPGQHLVLEPDDEASLLQESAAKKKYFSIASAPRRETPGLFELAVGGSEDDRALFEVGRRFVTSPPSGRAAIHPGVVPSRVSLIAMGTGVAPLRAVIEQLSSQALAPPLALLHGCRSSDELLFAAEFRALEDAKQLEYLPVLSRAPDGWQGLRGYVQQHIDRVAHWDAQFCVCGSNAMVQEVVGLLEQKGITGGQVFAEGYS